MLVSVGLVDSPRYARFDDASNTAIDFVQGTGFKRGYYTISDSAIVTAGIGSGIYNVRVFAGAAASQGETDALLDQMLFFWNGSVELPPQANITRILNALLAETTAGRIAANISTFFDNGNVVSTKKLDDIPQGFDINATGRDNLVAFFQNLNNASQMILDNLAAPVNIIIEADND